MTGLILIPDAVDFPQLNEEVCGEIARATGHVVLRGPKELLDQIRYVGDGDDPIDHDFEKYLP